MRRPDSLPRARWQPDRVARHGRAHPGEVEELGQEPREPIGFADDELSEGALVRVAARRATERFDRAPDRGERIHDLVRERRAQLSDGLQAFGARVQRVEPLLVRDVLEDRRRRGGCGAVALGPRRVQADWESPVAHRDATFGARRACAISRSTAERAGQLWRGDGDRFDYPGAQVLIERNPEQLRRCRVRVNKPARGVDRDDSAADILEDVSSLKANLHQLSRELLGAGTRLSKPGSDVPASERHGREYPELQPDTKVERRTGRYDDVGEVENAAECRDEQSAGVWQEQRCGGYDEDVKRCELRGSAPGYVDDRRYDKEIEQRLAIKEASPEGLPVDPAVQGGTRGEHEGPRDQQGGYQGQALVSVSPCQHRRNEDRAGHRESSQVHPAQNPVRIEDRLTSGVVEFGDGAHRLNALQIALE